MQRLNSDQAILIPERQNPLLVHRIVYFQDPTFKKLFDAQKGALPYPPKEAADVQVLTARMEALEQRLADQMLVDFVRPAKVKAGTPVAPEPRLAAEIVAREEIKLKPETAMIDADVPLTPEHAERASASRRPKATDDDLDCEDEQVYPKGMRTWDVGVKDGPFLTVDRVRGMRCSFPKEAARVHTRTKRPLLPTRLANRRTTPP